MDKLREGSNVLKRLGHRCSRLLFLLWILCALEALSYKICLLYSQCGYASELLASWPTELDAGGLVSMMTACRKDLDPTSRYTLRVFIGHTASASGSTLR